MKRPTNRLLLGLAGLVVAGAAIDTDRIDPIESQVFEWVNQLPDVLFRPVWILMQSGNIVAAPVAAGVAVLCGRRRLARRLLLTGTTTWVLAKVVKRGARRPRPGSLLPNVRRRGKPEQGLGFVSGHAAVATGLCAAIVPELGATGQSVTIALAAIVGLSRLYVGAHLPLDVLGGVALGAAVEAAYEL